MVRSDRVLDRVERLCSAGLGAKELRERVLVEIRRVIQFDAHVWLLTDPVTRVGTSPLADVPMLPWPRLPELGRLRYLTRTNRWSDLMEVGSRAALLSGSTAGELGTSLMWRDCLRELGVIDVASVAFWDRYGCWAWLDLWRCTPLSAYDDSDLSFLTDLSAPVTKGLREAQARTFVNDVAGMNLSGPAVVVLGTDLQVLSQTAWAAETLYRLNPPDDPITPIPAAVYNVAAARLAHEAEIPVGPPWSRIHLGQGRWVTLRADRMTALEESEQDAHIVVTIESSTPAERREVFALAHALTPREREVLDELSKGLDSRAIAEHFVLSEHTVNDHVKSVFTKTGTTTRQSLLSRIAGAS